MFFRPAFFIVMQPGIIEEVKKLIQPVLEQKASELVDLIYRHEGGRMVLRLLVDKEGGITLDDCADINKSISQILDQSPLIQQSYVLEVGSPGLDRPLVTKRDFQRKIGETVKLITRNNKGTTDTVIGILKSVAEDRVVVDASGVNSEFLFEDIIKAKLEITI